jgi:DUF917 family protein
MVLFDHRGNSVIVRSVATYRDSEKIARTLSVLWGGVTSIRCPVKGNVFRETIIPGRISQSMEIGKARREALAKGSDPVQAVIAASEGTLLIQGKVTDFEWADREGFMFGTFQIEGAGSYESHRMKIWLKNENLISWMDEKPYVMSPDLLCAVETEGATPFTNDQIRKGMDMTVFGVPPHPLWRTAKGIELVSARHFGYDLPYEPMEEVVKAFSGKP